MASIVEVAVRVLVWLAAAAVVLLLLPPRAAIATATVPAAEYGLSVVAGHDGAAVPGAWTPLTITLEPTRPIAGRLVVSTRSSIGTISRREQPIEVAGAARNVFRLVVPPGRTSVAVVEDGRRASVDVPGAVGPDRYLVGRVGGTPSPAPPLASVRTGRSGTWVAVDEHWLGEPPALESLTTLVVDASLITGLDGAAATGLAAAIVDGLDLVVVADVPGPVAVPGLTMPATVEAVAGGLAVDGPAAVLRGDGGVVAAATDVGRGRVLVSATSPEQQPTELWASLAVPGDVVAAGVQWDVVDNPWQFGAIALGGDGDVPTVPWLGAFLAAYILLVGPVNALVLHRLGRVELAWVTIPVVTALFTGGAFVGAVGSSPGLGTAGRVLVSMDGVGHELVVASARSPRADQLTMILPGGGWAVESVGEGRGGGVASVTLAPSAGGTRARFEVGALEVVGLLAERPTAEQPPLEVEARTTSDALEVVVRNVGPDDLGDVTVRTATLTREIGTVPAGELREVTIRRATLATRQPWFEGVGGRGGPDQPGPPASYVGLLLADELDGAPGTVWVTAATPRSDTGVLVGGDPAREDGTLVAVGVTPQVDGLHPAAVWRTLVSSDAEWRPGPLAVEGGGEAVLRFRLPAGTAPQQLVEDLERDEFGVRQTLEVWDVTVDAWVPLADAFPDGEGDPERLLTPLGELYVRATGEQFPFDFSARSVAGTTREGGP